MKTRSGEVTVLVLAAAAILLLVVGVKKVGRGIERAGAAVVHTVHKPKPPAGPTHLTPWKHPD